MSAVIWALGVITMLTGYVCKDNSKLNEERLAYGHS